MKKTVKFGDTETASNVAQHLYYVVQDSEKLIFSEFDDAAFKLAIALEGLTRADYSYIGDTLSLIPPSHTGWCRHFRVEHSDDIDDSLMPPSHTGVAFRAFGRPRITLEFTLNLPESQYRPLILNVLPDIVETPTDGYYEFTLTIDPPLRYLICILESTMQHKSVAEQQDFTSIVAHLERACMQIRNQRVSHNAFACGNLVLHGSGKSHEISLNLFDLSVNMSRSIFE